MTTWTNACAILGVTALMLLSGCLGPRQAAPVQRYAFTPEIVAPTVPETDYTLGLRPLVPALPYRLRMVYLEEQRRLGSLPLAEWAEQPAEAVTRALTDALAASGRFQDVGDAANMNRPDYILTGELRKFHENRTQEPWTAEIEVRLELRDATGTANPWSATLLETAAVDGADGAEAADFAAAMNKAIARLAGRTAKAIAAAELGN